MFLNPWLAILPVALALGIACSSTSPSVPQAQPLPAALVDAYQGWGETLYSERSVAKKWKDGSNWTDGVSQSPPSLPIGRNEYIGPNLTCAQAEVLKMAAFPEGEGYDVYNWNYRSDADAIGEQWRENFATLIWGDHPWAVEVYDGVSFFDSCGMVME